MNFPYSLLMVSFSPLYVSTWPITFASTSKLLAISIMMSAIFCVGTYNSILCPILNTLYISCHEVCDSSWIIWKSGGKANMLSLIICTFFTNSGCITLVCPPPEQWMIPLIIDRLSLSNTSLMIGAYVLVGERTSFPTFSGAV